MKSAASKRASRREIAVWIFADLCEGRPARFARALRLYDYWTKRAEGGYLR